MSEFKYDMFKSRLDNIKPYDGDVNQLNKFLSRCDNFIQKYNTLNDVELKLHVFQYIQEKLIGKDEIMKRLLVSNVIQRISNDQNLNALQKACQIDHYNKSALNSFIAGCAGNLRNNMYPKKPSSLEDAIAYVTVCNLKILKSYTLQEEISSIKVVGDATIANADPPSQSSDQSFDMFAVVQETRSKNLMIFNIVENTSNDTNVRVNHDKTHISDLLNRLEAQQVGEYKDVRVGKSGDRPRPIKVIFPDAHAVSQCVRSKYKIRESNIKIKPDLTVMQRGHLKSLFEELDCRKNDALVNLNGIMEIKCLHKVHKSGKTFEEAVLTDRTLCVENYVSETGREQLRLKRKHHYYYQVQGQLNICKKDICFFVVYINDEQPLYVDAILRDEQFWNEEMLPKLTNFYQEHMIPELRRNEEEHYTSTPAIKRPERQTDALIVEEQGRDMKDLMRDVKDKITQMEGKDKILGLRNTKEDKLIITMEKDDLQSASAKKLNENIKYLSKNINTRMSGTSKPHKVTMYFRGMDSITTREEVLQALEDITGILKETNYRLGEIRPQSNGTQAITFQRISRENKHG
ncbi:unnamed protein product [Ceutorhynchus assimilis]|uniref:YqaJ viral recombinase domain-containing protein n=1 Tax=Ceutorhynchus assimilis TaxID=467358 RepID=A0A9N9QH00_9CUCU|nr:unnamed protein product [Ceutorhynchus assimilis]